MTLGLTDIRVFSMLGTGKSIVVIWSGHTRTTYGCAVEHLLSSQISRVAIDIYQDSLMA